MPWIGRRKTMADIGEEIREGEIIPAEDPLPAQEPEPVEEEVEA